MKVALDKNALMSGIFLSGPPGRIFQAWRSRKLQLVVSVEVLEEYLNVAERLATRYTNVEYQGILPLVIEHAELVQALGLKEPVCEDPDADKFLACAIATKVEIVVSGDKALLKASGYHGIQVKTPKEFVLEYLD